MEQKDLGKTSTGIQPNVAGLLAYLIGFITGIIFYLIEKENKFVRFHAMQSMITFGALFVLQIGLGMLATMFLFMHLGFMMPIFSLLNIVVMLGSLILWIVLMIKAYQGELFKLPVLGDIAQKNS